MRILGIKQPGSHNTSACLLIDGKLQFAICEERITREKKTKKFPINAVKACLKYGQISIDDIDYVAVGWNPAVHLERLQISQVISARYYPENFYSVPAYLSSLVKENKGKRFIGPITEMNLPFFSDKNMQIRFIDHHLAHAASVFYMSGFDESAVLVVDAFGEKYATTLVYADKNNIEVIDQISFPQSLGVFYQLFTEFLGFVPNSDEWKVMGAAAYGKPGKYYDRVRSLLNIFPENDNRLYEVDLSYNDHYLFLRPHIYNEKFIELFGEPIQNEEDFKIRGYDIAAAVQQVTEEVVFAVLRKLCKLTKSKNICLTGGLAMNCVMNGKVIEHTPFKNIYVNFCSDDTGTSIGAALYLHHCFFNNQVSHDNSKEYLGFDYPDAEIEQTLNRYKITYRRANNIFEEASDFIINGKIIGWFQGRSEYGERALGNRSIIADPRRADVKDRINSAVKYRENFRPFAPAILEDFMNEYFINASPTPYMEKAFLFREDVRERVPAVVHNDGTGRLQTVNKKDNERWYRLIETFYKKTGVPMIVNTSFNIKGEPIVETPSDALSTFFRSGLDALFIHDFIVEKHSQ